MREIVGNLYERIYQQQRNNNRTVERVFSKTIYESELE